MDKGFRIGDRVFVTRHIPGAHYVMGDQATVVSRSNHGTKKKPVWRYYIHGAFVDPDALSATDPLAGMRTPSAQAANAAYLKEIG